MLLTPGWPRVTYDLDRACGCLCLLLFGEGTDGEGVGRWCSAPRCSRAGPGTRQAGLLPLACWGSQRFFALFCSRGSWAVLSKEVKLPFHCPTWKPLYLESEAESLKPHREARLAPGAPVVKTPPLGSRSPAAAAQAPAHCWSATNSSPV